MTISLTDILWWTWSVHKNVYSIPKSFTWLTYTCGQGISLNFPNMKILIHYTIHLAWFHVSIRLKLGWWESFHIWKIRHYHKWKKQIHFPILQSLVSYKQQFFTNSIVRILRVNKVQKIPFYLKLCGKTYPYSAKAYEKLVVIYS